MSALLLSFIGLEYRVVPVYVMLYFRVVQILEEQVMAKIDVLLATYNGEKYISEQIDSLLRQSNKEWKVIAHDDGSTDRTPEILREYQANFPEKIILIEDGFKSGGAKNNFHHLLRFTDAPYVMFCDQDDVWLDNKIDVTLSRMMEEEYRLPESPILVHSDLKVVDECLSIISDSMFAYQRLPILVETLDELMVQNNITGCTVMVNRKALEVSMPIPEAAIMHDWWIGCKVLQFGGRVSFVAEPLIKYRQHSSNAIGSKSINFFYYIKKAFYFTGVVNGYGKIYQQAKAIDARVDFFAVVYSKCMCVGRRAFGLRKYFG